MSSSRLLKFSFKSGGSQVWTDWSKELMRRKDEVIATLKNEGVYSESCFLSEDGESVYYFMEAEDFQKIKESNLMNPHPIDIEHKNMRENSLVFVAELECLFHFQNYST